MSKASTSSQTLTGADKKLDWRAMLHAMAEDGLIDAELVASTEARFGAGDSAQHPLVRLGRAGLTRRADGKSLDIASFEQLVELGKANKQLDANDQGVVQVVDWLWQYAFDQRASDIHLEPRREMGVIRFRIDGVLHTVYQCRWR
jgi:type II secretory ATPase GspE/PulE/Tfp pilus assembly ATPase PilB-like protein